MVYNIFKEDCGCAYKLFTLYLQKNQIVHCYDMIFSCFYAFWLTINPRLFRAML